MEMWGLLGKGMSMVGQITPPVYCHKGDDPHSSRCSNLWQGVVGKIVEFHGGGTCNQCYILFRQSPDALD